MCLICSLLGSQQAWHVRVIDVYPVCVFFSGLRRAVRLLCLFRFRFFELDRIKVGIPWLFCCLYLFVLLLFPVLGRFRVRVIVSCHVVGRRERRPVLVVSVFRGTQ